MTTHSDGVPITDATALAPDVATMERHLTEMASVARQVLQTTSIGPEQALAAMRECGTLTSVDIEAVSNHLHQVARTERPWWRRWLP